MPLPGDGGTSWDDGSTDPTTTAPGSSGTNWETDPFGLGDLQKAPIYVGDQVNRAYTGGSMGHSRGDAGDAPRTQTGNAMVNQYKSAEDLLKMFAGWSQADPKQYLSMQRLLYAGGFYGGSQKINWGAWNAQSGTAMKDAFQAYLQVSSGAKVPVTFAEFLKTQAGATASGTGQYGNGDATDGTATGGSAAQQVSLTDPAALRAYANQAAQAALGRSLSDDELGKFVDEFHSQEQAAGTSAAPSVVAPNPSAQATEYVRQVNPEEYGQHQVESYANSFLNMFLPSGSARPNELPAAGS